MYETLLVKQKALEERFQVLQDEATTYKEKVKEQDMLTRELQREKERWVECKSVYDYTRQKLAVEKSKALYLDACTFKTILDESLTDTMMYTLNAINCIIKKYTDGFFDDTIDFSFVMNEEKGCIDTLLEYNDRNPTDLSTLSGGEYDRVVIAVALSFAEFFKLPLLLMDEVVNSLDLYTCQKVISHIQTCYPKDQTIVYVGHQMIQGIFQFVYCLD
jgi:ATPase subunit of ABC transporter with duplicated ATPase domains